MKLRYIKPVILAFLVFTLVLASACSGAKSASGENPNYIGNISESGRSSGYADNTAGQTGDKANGTEVTDTGLQSTSPDRKEILNVNMSVETQDYKKTLSSIKASTAKYGGYIQSSSEAGSSYGDEETLRKANFVIRIPRDKTENFLTDSESFGNIVSNSRNVEDVTDSYFDTDAHLKVLRVQEQRYLDLLSKAAKMDDILQLEKSLSDVRYEIEKLTGTLKKYDSLIAYSTITIDVREVSNYTEKPVVTKTFWDKLGQSFTDSVKALKATLEFIALLIVTLLPFLVIIGGITAIVFICIRFSKKKTKKPLPTEKKD